MAGFLTPSGLRGGAARWLCTGLILASVWLDAACTGQPAPTARKPSASRPPAATSSPSAPPLPCASAQADTRADGVTSNLPAFQLASGLNHAEDLLVDGNQILVGEYTSGQIARLGGPAPVGAYDHLPVHVPEVEGLARIGDTLFAGDQANDRIVTVKGDQVATFFQLQPVRGLDGVDGIAAAGNTLIVPDSPHGTVLFIGLDGAVQRRVGGFSRPTGAWPLPDGSVLVADENAGSVVKLHPDGSKEQLVSGLPLADDVAADAEGRIYAISIGRSNLVELSGGTANQIAGNLRQPQGLGIDGAGNVLVTEYDAGRLDAVVRSFRALPAMTSGPSLASNQPLCIRLVRAPGFQDPVTIDPGTGYQVAQEPGSGTEGSVFPRACSSDCRVDVTLKSGARTDTVSLTYTR